MAMNIENGRLVIHFDQAPLDAEMNGHQAVVQSGQDKSSTSPGQQGAAQENGKSTGGATGRTSMEQQAEFFRVMDNMRKCEELCDATLYVEDQEIQVHKVVLAACSSFFHAMFTTRMTEARTSRVKLKDVSWGVVQDIVNFAYTAEIHLTDDNVQELLSAANQYQIQPVKDACCEYLKLRLSAANCLGIKDFADFHNCPELYQAAVQFVDEFFQEVCQGDEFLQMSREAVLELLGRDELTVKCEDEVYEAAIRWLKHDYPSRLNYKKEVLSKVRFPLITKKFLTTHVQQEPLMQDCCHCLRMIIGGMQYHLLGKEVIDPKLILNSVQPRVKKHHYQIALFGGSEVATCEYFDPRGHKWTDFEPMTEKRRDHGAARVGSNVYILGGSYLFTVSRIDCFNVATQRWSIINARLDKCRDALAVCSYADLIYISGGTQSHGNTAVESFEIYNPKADVLVDLSPMSQARFDHGLVECRGFLYVCGGSGGQNHPLKHCEKYNLATNKWMDIPPMNSARRGLGLAVVGNKIYAIGGQDETGALDTVECFDPVHCRWTQKARMPYKLRTVKCGVIGDSVWVVAGYRDMGRLSTVLEFKTTENKWMFHYNTRSFPQCNAAVSTVDTCVVE